MRVAIDGVRHHKCDWCKCDFTEENREHISIEIGERSGRSAVGTSALPGWRFTAMLIAVNLDFCNALCVGSFFANCWESPEYVR